MGKVILCKGRVAEKPFIIPLSGRELYSIEEICYYVYNNIYSIDIGFFSDELLEFIEKDLDLPEIADELRDLLESGHVLRNVVTALLLSCDLYNRKETEELILLMNRLSGMSAWQKRAHIGYEFLREGQYIKALRHFRGILKFEDLNEKDYGDVLFAIGCTLAHTASYREAADCFYKSYLHGRNRKSLIYTLLCFKLGDLGKQFNEQVGSLPKDDPAVLEAEKIWDEARKKAEDSVEYRDVSKLLDGVSGEHAREYRRGIAEKLQDLKEEYKRGVENGPVS